ncbi:MAG: DUF983 domain-containing protein [Alphaproteobacteria bacterium]
MSPFTTGLKGRCPACGEGALFDGFLKFSQRCEGCGADFDIEDAGDGPAVFVILIVGIVIIPLALAFQLITDAPMWLTMLIWMPILVMSCLALLRPLRGIMFSLQWVNQAREAGHRDVQSRDVED